MIIEEYTFLKKIYKVITKRLSSCLQIAITFKKTQRNQTLKNGRAYQERAISILKATKESNPITIKANTESLEQASLPVKIISKRK